MTPLDIVSELLTGFNPQEYREEKLAQALRELVALQKFDLKTGRMCGPRLDVAAVARHAGLPRGLISHEGCKLHGARDLVVDTLGLLSEHNLQVECDYLTEENKRLKARLDRHDSAAANRVVLLHKQRSSEGVTPEKRSTPEEVRKAVRLVPMTELKVAI